jgi:hypothetical protein
MWVGNVGNAGKCRNGKPRGYIDEQYGATWWEETPKRE